MATLSPVALLNVIHVSPRYVTLHNSRCALSRSRNRTTRLHALPTEQRIVQTIKIFSVLPPARRAVRNYIPAKGDDRSV